MIALYPDFSEISADLRPVLHPRFKTLAGGISEFTFANIYLFRETLNREQDLGDPGLRQAKESYHPVGFVKKYRAAPASSRPAAATRVARRGSRRKTGAGAG